MDTITLTKIQYCLQDGSILHTLPFQVGYETTYVDCEALVQKLLSTYWRAEGDAIFPMHKSPKSNPLPELVRIMAEDGTVFCQLSIDEILSLNR